MKKILTVIALICFFAVGAEARFSSNTAKISISKPSKKKVKQKIVYGLCGSGLIYSDNGNIAGYWSCWDSADGTRSVTITRVGGEE